MDVKIPFNLFLKIALLITTTILGPGDIAPNRQTANIFKKIIYTNTSASLKDFIKASKLDKIEVKEDFN